MSRSSLLGPGALLVLLSALLFGVGPTLARLAYDGGADGLALQIARFGFGAVALLAYLAFRGAPRPPSARQALGCAIVGLAIGAGSWTYLTSITFIEVPLASLIFFTFPLMVGVIAHLLPGDHGATMDRRQAMALLIAFAGLVILLGVRASGLDGRGVVLAFAAAAFVSVSFIVTPALSRELGAVSTSFMAILTAAIVYAVLVVAAGGVALPSGALGWVGLLGNAGSYTFGLLALFAGLPRAGPTTAALLTYLEPLVSVLSAALVLGQFLSPLQAVGGALVLAALWFGRK